MFLPRQKDMDTAELRLEIDRLKTENERLKEKLASAWQTIEDIALGTKLTCPLCGELQPCDCSHK